MKRYNEPRLSASRFRRELLPPARSFYESELGKLSRPSRGWARSRCPFHNGNNPWAFSVNLGTGGFHCFNCGVKGGDVVAFVMIRDRVDFKDACRRLGVWDKTSTVTADQVRAHQRAREKELAAIREKKEAERRERMAVRDEIHADNHLIKDISDSLRANPESMPLWLCLVLAWESRGLSERQYMVTAGLEDSDGL